MKYIVEYIPAILASLTSVGSVLAVINKLGDIAKVKELLALTRELKRSIARQNDTIDELKAEIKTLERKNRGVKDEGTK